MTDHTLLPAGHAFCVGSRSVTEPCLTPVAFDGPGLCPTCCSRLSPRTRARLEQLWSAPRSPGVTIRGLYVDEVHLAEMAAAIELVKAHSSPTEAA